MTTQRTPNRIVAAFALAFGAATMAATPAHARDQAPLRTLVYCSVTNPNGFQPALYTDEPTFEASSRTIFDRLVAFNDDASRLVPSLAESWDISADGLRYTFHLRRGVRFQSNFGFRPTRDFNADDVLFTFDRMRLPSHPYHAVSGGTYTYFKSMGLGRLIRAIDKVDPYTVRFTLAEPNAPFLSDMAMDFASIDSAEYGEMLLRAHRPEDFDRKPVGTGSFMLKSYQPGSEVRYEAFQEAWRGRPAIDRLVFAITPDASVRWSRLRAGECQAMNYPAPTDLPAMRADPAVRVVSAPGMNEVYIGLNLERAPLGDARVRRALALAIDKRAIVDAVFRGDAVVAHTPLPPGMPAAAAQVDQTPFDPAQARRLLREAGYPKGFDTDVWAVGVGQGLVRDPRRIAVMIQADWAAIGVRARVVTYEWGEYLRRLGNGEHGTALVAWGSDNGDPDNFIGALLSCSGVHTTQNISEYCRHDFDALLDHARASHDAPTRLRLYRQAQARFQADLPFIPLAHVNQTAVISRRVQGFVANPFGIRSFDRVRLVD